MRPNEHILGGGRFICHYCGYIRESDQRVKEDTRKHATCASCLERARMKHTAWANPRLREPDYMTRVISDAELEAEAEAEANRQSAILAELRRRWESEPLPEWPGA